MPAGAAVGGTPHLISTAPDASVRIGMLGALHDALSGTGADAVGGGAGGWITCGIAPGLGCPFGSDMGVGG
jgi:hypothetical protein